MDIAISGAARAGLFALGQISSQIDVIQKHLATGRRVSEPFDNPIAYFTAAGLQSRAATLNSLMDGIGSAQKTIDAANKGIAAVQSLLQSAQSVANQALASANTLVKITGNNSTALTTSTKIASTGGNSTQFKAGDTVTVSDGTTTATYTAANNDTVQTFLNAVNGTSGLKVTASLTTGGQIQLQATAGVNVTIGGTTTGSGTLNSVTGLTAGTTNFVANTTRQTLATQFDSIRGQIDQAIQDASYNGVDLINGGSLSVTFNETGTSKITIAGVQFTSSSLGVAATANQWQSDTDVSTSIANVTAALSTLQAQSASFGSNSTIMQARQDFTKNLIDTLQSGADSLTIADTNEESALLLALQTRQQIATTSLSMANASNQASLRLFGLG